MAEGDEFATLSSAALKEAATAAIDIVEGVAGRALGAASGGAFEFFETLAERNNQAIAAFRLNALEDEVINLRNELRALVRRLAAEGRKPDRQDPMSQTTAASEFVRNISEARTVEKRTALVHATVAQFDPRKGSPATRDYWLRRVRELPEIHLDFVLLVDRYRPGFVGDALVTVPDGLAVIPEEKVAPLALTFETVGAYRSAAAMLTNEGVGTLVLVETDARQIRLNGSDTFFRSHLLTSDGRILVSFCKDD